MTTQDVIVRVQDTKTGDFPVQLMKTGMDTLLRTSGDTGLVLDLLDCRAIDSRTIGTIVNLTNRFSRENRRFTLRNVNNHIRKVLDFMNLTQFLHIENEAAPRPIAQVAADKQSLKVDYDAEDGVGVFKFNGAIDSSMDSAMFLNIINKIISDGNRMLIDMSGITFIDSLGVGVIIRLIKLMREGKAEVRFFGASPFLREVLELNNLNTIIHIYTDKDDALKAWA